MDSTGSTDYSAKFVAWLAALAGPEGSPASPAGQISLPFTLGRFRLERLLGKGAYGAVFRAYNTELERAVALKIAWPHIMYDEVTSLRFAEEPKSAGRLKHSGIVTVYTDQWIGSLYCLELELIDGPNLAEWAAAQTEVPWRTAARLVAEAAEAADFAHAYSIIHRDLKPSNILLRPGREHSEDTHQAVLADFGLAHRPRGSQAAPLTRTHDRVGTDPYIAPEHWDEDKCPPAPTSDVFSLGVILYELVASQRPFRGASAHEIQRAIREDQPVPLGNLRRAQRDLNTIALACLEKDPTRRYPTAGALAVDLRRMLAGEPIVRRPPALARRAAGWLRQHSRAASLLAAGVMVLEALALQGGLVRNRPVPATMTREAEEKIASLSAEVATVQAVATRAKEQARQQQYATTFRQAADAQRRGNRGESLSSLQECRKIIGPQQSLPFEWQMLQAMNSQIDKVLTANIPSVLAMQFSADDQVMYTGGDDTRIIVWDTATWKKTKAIWNPGAVNSLKLSDDGKHLAAVSHAGRVAVYSTEDYSRYYDEKIVDGRAFCVTWLGDSEHLAVGGEDATLHLLDLTTGEHRTLGPLDPSDAAKKIDSAHPNEIADLLYLPSSHSLVVVKAPPEVVFVDPQSLQITNRWDQWTSNVCFIGKDEGWLAFNAGNEIDVRAIDDGQLIASIPCPELPVQLCYSGAASLLAAACRDGSIQTWDIAQLGTGSVPENRRFPGHKRRARTITASSHGGWLASGGADGKVHVWHNPDLGSFEELPLEVRPWDVQFSPCGRWLAIVDGAEFDSRLTLIDVPSGKPLWTRGNIIGLNTIQRSGAVFSPTGDEVYIQDVGHSLLKLRSTNGESVSVNLPSVVRNSRVWFSGDGTLIVTNPERKVTTECSPSTGALLEHASEHDPLGSFLSSPGEIWLESDSSHNVQLSHQIAGRVYRALEATPTRTSLIDASGDGRWLAGGDSVGMIHLWDLQSIDAARHLSNHEAALLKLQFSADGRRFISASNDHSFRVWDVATASELLKIGSTSDKVFTFGASPDESLLVLAVEHDERFWLRIYRLNAAAEKLLPVKKP